MGRAVHTCVDLYKDGCILLNELHDIEINFLAMFIRYIKRAWNYCKTIMIYLCFLTEDAPFSFFLFLFFFFSFCRLDVTALADWA